MRDMPADWTRLCHGPDFTVSGDTITITLSEGRRHTVQVIPDQDGFGLRAVAVGRAAAERARLLPTDLWERNRTMRVASYVMDQRGRVLVTAWLPDSALTADEFRFVVHRVAVEADRLEYLLTGKDLR
jgi:hypothetical protein